MITRANVFLQKITVGFAVICGILLLVQMLVVVVDVSNRYFLGKPITGATETTELLLPYIAFLGLAYGLIEGSHVRVTLITDMFPPPVQLRFEIAAYVIGMVFCGLMTYYGWLHFWASFVIGEELNAAVRIPWWLAKMSAPIGFFVLFVQMFLLLLADFSKLTGKDRGKSV